MPDGQAAAAAAVAPPSMASQSVSAEQLQQQQQSGGARRRTFKRQACGCETLGAASECEHVAMAGVLDNVRTATQYVRAAER